MANSSISVTEGSGKNIATYSVSESTTKELQRIVLNDSTGTEVTPANATLVGAVTETAPATDTASSGLNGRLQRIAQRLTSIIALLPTALGANGGLKIEGVASGTAVPVSIATAPVLVAGTALIGKVGIDQTTPGTTNAVSLAQIGGTTIVNGGLAGSLSVGGTVATNVAISANPLNLGAQAVSSENTAVTTARQVQLVADLVGKLIVLPYANPENFVSGAISSAMTGTTSTSLIAAPASGLRNYITQITVSNSHATVGTDILIQDGSGGTTLYVIPAAAVYGGATLTFPTPLRQPTTATAIYAQNVTTGSSIKVSASGYKGA